MAPNDDSASLRAAADGRLGDAADYVNGTTIDWSFLNQILRGTLYASFVAIIGVLTDLSGAVAAAMERFGSGVGDVSLGVAVGIRQAFVSARTSLANYPPALGFVIALVTAFVAAWALDVVFGVFGDA